MTFDYTCINLFKVWWWLINNWIFLLFTLFQFSIDWEKISYSFCCFRIQLIQLKMNVTERANILIQKEWNSMNDSESIMTRRQSLFVMWLGIFFSFSSKKKDKLFISETLSLKIVKWKKCFKFNALFLLLLLFLFEIKQRMMISAFAKTKNNSVFVECFYQFYKTFRWIKHLYSDFLS